MKRLVLLALTIAAAADEAAALQVAQPNGSKPARAAGTAASFVVMPTFREDAWYLPQDSLLGFAEIPGGPFLMGSDAARDSLAFDNEFWAGTRAQRRVDVAAFYLGRYEVTVAQFKAFVHATGYRADPQALAGAEDHPIAHVTWPDALAYTRWLESTLKAWSGTPPTIARLLAAGWKITLPTEAQWEKAARGPDGRTFPWGNETLPSRANFRSNGTTAVGSFACNECAYGLSDMSGNVWEWTRTPYSAGPHQVELRSVDLVADALWVMRGGSYRDTEREVRAAIRGGGDPGVRRPFIGFRVALVPPGGLPSP